MILTWGLAVLLSFALRLWGIEHPEPFGIRPLLVYALLFVPSVVLGIWVLLVGFSESTKTID